MVLLGTVFELTTSPVLFAAIGRRDGAEKQSREGLILWNLEQKGVHWFGG